MKSLHKQTQELSKQSADKIPEEIKKTMGQAQKQLENSGLLESTLTQGDTIPEFTLKDQNGQKVTITDELSQGPVILNFYRGGWCPYCNLELKALQEHLDEFNKYGAQLIAITPQKPDESLNDQERHELEFSILSDTKNSVAEEFGLVYDMTEELVQAYNKLGLDVEKHNGEGETRLPLAATYVVDQKGIIQYAFVKYDYTQRAEPKDVLQALKQLTNS